ncbi:Ig-like domain-containing protein [candidate division KSB1 bacterium]|nr:Ig-like domain-containing protein [candidate division KSB1 bacterium]
MRRYFLVFGLCAALFALSDCGKDEEPITAPNVLEDLAPAAPSILADGVSTIDVRATVLDSTGRPSRDVKVFFTTSHGSITKYAFTDDSGQATATLTSVASELDVRATVTASLSSLGKGSSSMRVSLECPAIEPATELQKETITLEDPATINVTFLGVLFEYKLDATELPADGISSTNLTMTVKERSTRKVVPDVAIRLRAIYTTVDAQATTDQQGMAVVKVVSHTAAVRDSIHMEIGNRLRYRIAINYITPKIVLLPDSTSLEADGFSKAEFTARLLSQTNNPIVGATIQYTATAGSITGSSVTDDNGEAVATLISGTVPIPSVLVIARFNNIADTSHVIFAERGTLSRNIVFECEKEVLRNGIAKLPITAVVLDERLNPVPNTTVRFSAVYGTIDSIAVTNSEGKASVIYTPDAGETDLFETITAKVGLFSQDVTITLLGISMQVSADPLSIPADGQSKSKITAILKQTSQLYAIPDALLSFSTTLGTIPRNAITDPAGTAVVDLIAGNTDGTAEIKVQYGLLTKTVLVELTPEIPNSILLTASPQFIWVKETGELEQTMLSARVLTQTGRTINASVAVQFTLLHGPDGGEFLEPGLSGSKTVSEPIRTQSGEARVKMRAGIRPGPVEIQAQLIDYPEIIARSSEVIIRSGPPYIWIDPTDKNNVESHLTVAFDYLNLPGWIYVRDFNVSIFVGDKYNNPVEQSTVVYLRSSGGIMGTDVSTDNLGVGQVLWHTAKPMPVVEPIDANALKPHEIANPNDDMLTLPIILPDFEGDGLENDGVAVVMAYTHGRDQNGNDAVVWTTGMTVFSGPVMVFDLSTDKTALNIGEVATITVRLYDINGNPVAAGSELKAETSEGKLSSEILMAAEDDIGFGTTYFQTQLLNDLDKEATSAKTATVTFRLKSPNGNMSRSIQILLRNQ